MTEWDTLAALSTAIINTLPSDYYAAYFELIHHPVLTSRNTQAIYVAAGYNQLYASQARSQTNAMADLVGKFFEYDADLRDQYHGLLNGKWDHQMDQTHLGCESYQVANAT
jgi:hypothetical protein